MNENVEKNEMLLNEVASIKEIDYFSDGLGLMFEHESCGYLPAFPSESLNQKGIFFKKEDFEDLLNDLDVKCNLASLPDYFRVFIKYSPIVLFKYWIFTISNVDKVKISERSSAFERDYFFLIIDDFPQLFSITTNIAHERFLANLYWQQEIPIRRVTFSTFLQQGKKLVVYRDYRERKVSTVSVKKALQINKIYPISIVFMKTADRIKFSVQIDGGDKINHVVRLKKSVKEAGKERLKKDTEEILKKYRDEAIGIVEKMNGETRELNKHANLSLGRVNKVPILINLPRKNANITIHLSFDKEKEVLTIWDESKKEIKSFQIASAPKSNWLEVM